MNAIKALLNPIARSSVANTHTEGSAKSGPSVKLETAITQN